MGKERYRKGVSTVEKKSQGNKDKSKNKYLRVDPKTVSGGCPERRGVE